MTYQATFAFVESSQGELLPQLQFWIDTFYNLNIFLPLLPSIASYWVFFSSKWHHFLQSPEMDVRESVYNCHHI